jgi:trimeric autotransporter adhesin
MKTPKPFTNCIYSSCKRSALLCLSLLIGCFELLPQAQAVDPPPDGGYPGGNTAEGDNALLALTDGGFNTAVGFYSLASVTTGQLNTAIGSGTLLFNTGNQNTATGAAALFNNTTGNANTATGAFALANNTTGARNTADGNSVMVSNTTGHDNTAVGSNALYSNETGNYNVAIGPDALKNNINGQLNTAMNVQALFLNTSGSQNVAVGMQTLLVNTTGNENTAVGTQALGFNATGIRNTALGTRAGQNLTTGDYNIDIGAQTKGVAGESGTTRIGTAPFHTRAFIAGIRGVTTENNDAVPVVIDSDGQLGTVSSSRRYKTDIQPIEQASESILALKPVSFRYKVHKDTMPNFGLIAEDVAKINPDLVIYDADGNPFTVRYDAVNAMLLNEFLKEHRKVAQQEQKLARQETTIAQLQSAVTKQEATAAEQRKEIAALTAGLQRVSAQVETSRPAPHVVVNQQ